MTRYDTAPQITKPETTNLFLDMILKIEINAYILKYPKPDGNSLQNNATATRIMEMSAAVFSPVSEILQHASGEECSSNEPDTNALICRNSGRVDGTKGNISYTTILKSMLTLKREIVLDFTSLKSCLDPQKEKLNGEDVCVYYACAFRLHPNVCCACITV